MASVEWRIDGAVRRVLLNRPEKRNALDGAMLEALTAAFAEPPREAERVAVIRAEGPVFCAGLDLRARVEMGDNPIEAMLHAIETYPLPVVAVVQGDAIAGGNELALHCDFVVASSAARFGMSLARIGLAPSWFLAKKLLEVAGPVATREMLLLGDPLPASRHCRAGHRSRIWPSPTDRGGRGRGAVAAGGQCAAVAEGDEGASVARHEVPRRHRPCRCRSAPGRGAPPAPMPARAWRPCWSDARRAVRGPLMASGSTSPGRRSATRRCGRCRAELGVYPARRRERARAAHRLCRRAHAVRPARRDSRRPRRPRPKRAGSASR